MTFTLPMAFWGLLALPILLGIYLFRARFRDRHVSSLMFWQGETPPLAGGRRREPPRLPLFFYLEAVIIALLIFAAAGPRLPSAQPLRSYVVVLDDSFSMQARDAKSNFPNNLQSQSPKKSPDNSPNESTYHSPNDSPNGSSNDSPSELPNDLPDDLPDNSPKQRAIKALSEELAALPFSTVRFVLAGSSPQVMGEIAHSLSQVRETLGGWQCLSPTADLDNAIALARDLAGERGRVLILTDHVPQHPPEDGRRRWMAFGEPRPNIAFTQALRTRNDDQEHVMLEIVNLSTAMQKTQLTVEQDGNIQATPIELAPDGYRRIRLDLGDAAGTFTARLASDALDIDSNILLLPKWHRNVPAEVRVGEDRLCQALTRALLAGGAVSIIAASPASSVSSISSVFPVSSASPTFLTSPTSPASPTSPISSASSVSSVPTIAALGGVDSTAPLLIFTDREIPAPSAITGDAWYVQFITDEKAESFLGPFLIDHSSPLAEGLELQGTIWGAGRQRDLPGDPVITAGNIPLLSVRERSRGFDVFLHMNIERSNIPISPDWPILLYNLVSWRSQEMPGPDRDNLPLGSDLHVTTPFASRNIFLQDPDGRKKAFPTGFRRLTIQPEIPGLHHLIADVVSWPIAVNACALAESDLRSASTGSFGTWTDEQGSTESLGAAWMFLLPTLLLLAIHASLQAAGTVSEGTGRLSRVALATQEKSV
ncbi:MAG: BatA domain-containing protein [Candidatus Ozemobacteraceae bacterium]